MSFISILESFFLGPLKLVFEVIFEIAVNAGAKPGLAIVFLSLAMNFLVLPLYRRADKLQEQARDTEARLRDGVRHIKKTFSGNERMMMLQTYYRQNHYSPMNVFKSSVSLLLEIPFFMAAYQFLSGLEALRGVSFGPITDLGVPDGLLTLGSLTVNLLPILMTVLNFISAALYLKGFPLKDKLRTYGIALVFLVLLYRSPAGLVFYWTLNNLFSLLKNICYRLKPISRLKSRSKRTRNSARKEPKTEPDGKLFLLSAIFLTLLVGGLIPSNYIAASPQEYVFPALFFHPLWYVVNALLLAGGSFILWFGVFYRLAGRRGKLIFECMLFVLCAVMLTNYMFFGRSLSLVTNVLKFMSDISFSDTERLNNILVLAAVLGVFLTLVLLLRKRRLPHIILLTGILALAVMSAVNVVKIRNSISSLKEQEAEDTPVFNLSKNGKNVVVLFLDRALGEEMPYILNEWPGLRDTFDGFTWYSNVISYGGHTNIGAPALMGGYEYTPVEMNKRDNESLKDKHNESLKVMPVLFCEQGFGVTVCDPPYANYQWIPDLSIYDEYPEIRALITKGMFSDPDVKQRAVDCNLRNFFCFSLMKSMPVELQNLMYDDGRYLSSVETDLSQHRKSTSKAEGISEAFMDSFSVLQNLGQLTSFDEGAQDRFIFFYNDAPHEADLLQEPEYLPKEIVDNTEFDAAHKSRFKTDSRKITIKKSSQMAHYETNMACLIQVGKWLDLLRENGVYDNTRIIITADHGFYMYQTEDLVYEDGSKRDVDIAAFYPLLMVKDFGSSGFTISDEFMTNADTPVLAVKDIIENPVNPFTGKALTNSEKTAHDQFVMTSRYWNTETNNGNAFRASAWAIVTDDIWDRNDWRFIDDKIVLKEHEIPEKYRIKAAQEEKK